MSYAQAKLIDEAIIPVIDITALRDGSDPLSVARAMHAASTDLGFIYISGHGIPDQVIEDARTSAYDFFRGSEQEKSRVLISVNHRGWLGQGGAKMGDDARDDLKESFLWGHEGDSGDRHPLRGNNQWPDFVPAMRRSGMAYFDQVHEVARHLMRGFALGLDLDENFFLQHSDAPLSRMACVYYPEQPEDMGENQFGVGPHTDFGVLTVLCQDDTGGLQVEALNGDWVHAPPIPGTLIINVADLLARWTDGAYRSTPHRVVNTSGHERMSLVLAFDPNPETMIDSRDVFGKDHPAREQPITCGDYLNWRFEKAFSYRKQ